MLIGYMRVSSVDDRQSVDLQRDALLAAGVDERHLGSVAKIVKLEHAWRRHCQSKCTCW